MILQNDTYVEKAEQVMRELSEEAKQKRGYDRITTSQIRNLLSMTADIYNEVRLSQSETLNDDLKGRINYLKVRFIYEAGRDEKMNKFVERAKIRQCLDEIQGKKENYLLFSRYMEALVAYHKFYDGKD